MLGFEIVWKWPSGSREEDENVKIFDNNDDQRQRNQLGSNELKMKPIGLKAFVPSTKPKEAIV